MGRSGSDPMRTGHAVGTNDPPQMTHIAPPSINHHRRCGTVWRRILNDRRDKLL
jgi:hypothetical protein